MKIGYIVANNSPLAQEYLAKIQQETYPHSLTFVDLSSAEPNLASNSGLTPEKTQGNTMIAHDALLSDNAAKKSDKFDYIIVLGGDGLMLRALHEYMGSSTAFFGINCGSVGFLLNEKAPSGNLLARLEQANEVELHPLQIQATDAHGNEFELLAVNEAAITRQGHQSAKLHIKINGRIRLEELAGDGVIIATPAGSSAYNFAAHGPIVPIESKLLLLTPISPFRPKRWHGAIIPDDSEICIENQHSHSRPVKLSADFQEISDIISIKVHQRKDIKLKLLFDLDNNLKEKMLNEQF